MQADLPDDPLVRETMASLGPGAKDSTLDDLAAWIRQLEEMCDSKDAALAPASFRTDINGSCLSKFPASGTSAQRTDLQTKAVKGYPPLPELHMEKVSSKKKNHRGEAKLRLSVERGPILVFLTITDLDGVTRTLRAVAADDNDLIPIKHPATTIEATAVPFDPKQLLVRLRLVGAKMMPQREKHVQPIIPPQEHVEKVSAQRQADRLEYMTKRINGQLVEYITDREKGTMTVKRSGCLNPNCNDVNCAASAPSTMTFNLKTGEATADDPEMNAVVDPMMKSLQENPRRHIELCGRAAAILKEEQAIKEKLPTAKPAEKKRLMKELENNNDERAKLKYLMYRTAETGGWMGAPQEELAALVETAKQKDPDRVDAIGRRALSALDEHTAIKEKLESTSNQTKKKRLVTLLGRKEIEFDEAFNEIAVIADSSVQGGSKEPSGAPIITKAMERAGGDCFAIPKEELEALVTQGMQKDPMRTAALSYRSLAASKEYSALEEKLKSTSNQAERKRLATLLGRKKVECSDLTNEIAVIADGPEQKESKELYDAYVRADKATASGQSP